MIAARKAFAYFMLMLALPVLFVEIPVREMARAWRGMHIHNRVRDNLRTWRTYWRGVGE